MMDRIGKEEIESAQRIHEKEQESLRRVRKAEQESALRLQQIEEERAAQSQEYMRNLVAGHERLKREWLKFNRYKDLCEKQRKQHVNELRMVTTTLASHHKDILKQKAKLAKQRMHLDMALRNLNADPTLQIPGVKERHSVMLDTKIRPPDGDLGPSFPDSVLKLQQRHPLRKPSPALHQRGDTPFSPLYKDPVSPIHRRTGRGGH